MKWFQRLRKGLSKSSNQVTGGITHLFTGKKLDEETIEELEDVLICADLGPHTAHVLSQKLAKGRFGKEITQEEVRHILAHEIAHILNPVAQPLMVMQQDFQENFQKEEQGPYVILVVGVNGSGKTTTIGKMAYTMQKQGLKVLLAAGDTFRAAAIEQLEIWGERTKVSVVSSKMGGDPASLAFEAYQKAYDEGHDVVLVDTAGRLHNKSTLMAELEKIVRVIKKINENAPQAIVQVLDATIGQNTLQQVEAFQKVVPLTGLVVTKLDGTAKGGVVVALAQKFKLPIHAIGVGEQAEDMQAFSAMDFANNLMNVE